MPQILRTAAAAALALALGSAERVQAQGFALSHTHSVYADDKNGALRAPEGVACRGDVAVVADTGNKRLLRFSIQNGSLVGATELKAAQVTSPGRLQLDGKGNVLVLDQKSRRIARLDPAGAFKGFVEVSGATGGPVVVQSFKLDPLDGMYVLDGAGKRVLALDATGKVTREVALPKKGAIFGDFAVDAGGTLYAAESLTATVWAAAPDAAEFKALSKTLKDYMNFPVYIAANRGTLVLVDQYGHGLVTVGADGSYRGRQLALGWGDGLVYYPSQLCIGESEVLVADRYNNRVQVFTIR